MTDLRAFGVTSLAMLLGTERGKDLEESIFTYAINESRNELSYPTWDHVTVRNRFRDKLRMVLENVSNEHVKLKEKLLNGDVAVADVVSLTHEDLRPDAWLFQMTPAVEEKPTQDENDSQLKCNSCQRRGFPCYNTEYREFQTRAGDESTTIYAFCRTCLKRWKFS